MEENLGRIVVSFCIPVYNNALAAEAIVKELLSCEDSRFEVIVCDDNSQENVEELLTKIHDPRFRYYRNEKNLGAHKNWEHTLELGCGEWLYLIMGRDRMHGDKIPCLIEILQNARENNVVVLKDGFSEKKNGNIYSGINAMIEFVRVEHPTGDIYDREIYMSVQDRSIYFETSDMYPEARLKFDMLLKGNGKCIESGVYDYHEEKLVDFTKIKSGVENDSNIYDSFYAPRRSALQVFELIDTMDSKSLGFFSREETDRFFSARFSDILWRVTVGWYGRCADKKWTAHYGHKTRYIGSIELIRNVITAYKSTKAHLLEKGLFTSARQTIMRVNCGKAIAKCILYYPFKRAVKKIIQPLGLWELLTRIRRKFS